jgi:hypothetical protein
MTHSPLPQRLLLLLQLLMPPSPRCLRSSTSLRSNRSTKQAVLSCAVQQQGGPMRTTQQVGPVTTRKKHAIAAVTHRPNGHVHAACTAKAAVGVTAQSSSSTRAAAAFPLTHAYWLIRSLPHRRCAARAANAVQTLQLPLQLLLTHKSLRTPHALTPAPTQLRQTAAPTWRAEQDSKHLRSMPMPAQ